jgi:hypothetical protein
MFLWTFPIQFVQQFERGAFFIIYFRKDNWKKITVALSMELSDSCLKKIFCWRIFFHTNFVESSCDKQQE